MVQCRHKTEIGIIQIPKEEKRVYLVRLPTHWSEDDIFNNLSAYLYYSTPNLDA